MITATRIHLTIATLMGLFGVTLLAAAAHSGASDTVQIAGQLLLFHAPAVIAACAARRAELLADWPARLAISLLILGVALFAADLALRGFHGQRLFLGAAPAGGFMMLGGWLGLTLAALFAKRS
jgi:uncharacterized membrane protein YgdD (TMEM256/DUF423 family)